MSDSERRPIYVVGATGDIGQAVAHDLASKGHPLVLTYHSTAPSFLRDHKWLQVDVRDSACIRDVLQAESLRTTPYGLIYCAGVLQDHPVSLLKDETWDEVLQTNLKGAVLCVRAVARAMMAAGKGRIVLLGSVAGQRPHIGQVAYSSSKAGLEAACRAMAREFGRFAITCNVVVPGAIESKMFRSTKPEVIRNAIALSPLRRLGEPRHVAGAISYLLSDDADFVTGATLVIDGGLSI